MTITDHTAPVLDVHDLHHRWEAAFNAGGVQLVVVPIDYSENMRVLSDERSKLTVGPEPKTWD